MKIRVARGSGFAGGMVVLALAVSGLLPIRGNAQDENRKGRPASLAPLWRVGWEGRRLVTWVLSSNGKGQA